MAKNFVNMGGDVANWRHEAQYSKSFNPKRSSLGHSESRSQNQRQREFWKQKKEKDSSQTRKSPKGYQQISKQKSCSPGENGIFKAIKKKICQPSILYSAKLSFRNEREEKTFPGNYLKIINTSE